MAKMQLGKGIRRYRKKRRGLTKSNVFGSVSNIKISVNMPLYAIATPTVNYYSVENVVGPVYGHSIHVLLNTNEEFINLRQRFTFFRINGVSLTCLRGWTASLNNWAALPEIYLDVAPSLPINTLTSSSAVYSDTNFRIQIMNQDSRPVSKYYRFTRQAIENSGGYCSLSNTWLTTNNMTTNNFGVIALGFNDAPTYSNVPTENLIFKIASIELDFYLSFARSSKYYAN